MTEQVTSTSPSLLKGSYIIDPIHSNFAFAIQFQGVSIYRGLFADVGATLIDGQLSGSAEVESISIYRPQQFRDHILGTEFFDAETYPTMDFKSSEIELRDDGVSRIVGDLTIKGRTKSVEGFGQWRNPELDGAGRVRGHIDGKCTIDRRDFGLHWNAVLPSGIAALGHDVTVTIEASIIERGV
jgi:polyisoprenoid-binding protein YceI